MSDRERINDAIDVAMASQADEAIGRLIDELQAHGLEYEIAATVGARLASAPSRALIGRCLYPHASSSVASVQPIFDPAENGGAMYWQCTETEKHRTVVVAAIKSTQP